MKYIKEYKPFWVGVASIILISYGASAILPFLNVVCVLLGLWCLIYYYLVKNLLMDVTNPETEKLIADYDETLRAQEEFIAKQADVVKEYEDIFDSMLVKLPCICGGNTFEGLFSPNTVNEVTCENCKNKYNVTIQYDTVLISEPLNLEQPFEKMIGKID